MKAGLVTFYHIHHYGALLQAAATERAVESLGWDCEIVDYYVNQDNALFRRPTGLGSAAHDAHTALHYGALSERYRRFEQFSRERLHISARHYRSWDELAAGALPYDVLLSGSDQIWNPKIFPDVASKVLQMFSRMAQGDVQVRVNKKNALELTKMERVCPIRRKWR